jgi:hypothetical protein
LIIIERSIKGLIMKANTKAAFISSFIEDNMAMGVDWVKETNAIQKQHGKVPSRTTPREGEYRDKKAENLTQYGDQACELFMSVYGQKRFEADQFMSRWRAVFKSDASLYVR